MGSRSRGRSKDRKRIVQDNCEPRFRAPVVAAAVLCVFFFILRASFISKLPAVLGLPGQALLVPFWTASGAALLAAAKCLLAVGFLTGVMCGAGELLRRRFWAGFGGGWERWTLRFSLGYMAAAWLFFVLAAAQLLTRKMLFGMLIVGAAAALYAFLTREEGLASASEAPVWDRRSWLHWGCALILVLGAAGSLPYAFIPETFHDALKYHLELPGLYLLNHGMLATPRNIFSGVPSMPQMVYGWTLLLSPDGAAARLLHWSVAFWVFAGLMGFCRRLGKPEAGPLAAAFFFSAPVVLVESFRTSVGMEWTLFELVSIHAFWAAVHEAPGGETRRRWLLLCGLMMGTAMASKYPAWVYPAGFAAAALWLRLRDPDRALSVRETILPFAAGAAMLLPWVLKNAVLYGNPLYPYYHDFIRPAAAVQPNWRSLSDFWDWPRILGTWAGAREFFTVPWTLTAGAGDIGKSFGPVFFGMLPLLVLVRFSKPVRFLGILAFGCFLPLLLMTDYPRYFVPHLAGLAVFWAVTVTSMPGTGLRNALPAAALAVSACGILVFLAVHPRRANWPVLLGKMTRSEFLGHTRHEYPDPPFAAYEYLNENSPPDARVLIIGDGRGFYLRRAHLLATLNQTSDFESWAAASTDAAGLEAEFRKRGIGWVVVNHGEMSRTHMEMKLPPERQKIADAFIRSRTRQVFEVADAKDRRVAVYRLLQP